MRRLSLAFILFALGCAHDASHESGPLSPVDGGVYGLTGSSEGAPPVLLNRYTSPVDGGTITDYLVSDQIMFVYETGRAVHTSTTRQVTTSPGSPTESTQGTVESSGLWTQSGDKVLITWERNEQGLPATGGPDTLELVNSQLRRHIVRPACDNCTPGTRVDLVYARGGAL